MIVEFLPIFESKRISQSLLCFIQIIFIIVMFRYK